MKALLIRRRDTRTRTQASVSVTTLEGRRLLSGAAVTLPAVNLSQTAITEMGQQLANFAQHRDASNALTDLNNVLTAINNDIQRIETHPGHNPFQKIELQFDVDAQAVVQQAITDLTPSTGDGGTSTGPITIA